MAETTETPTPPTKEKLTELTTAAALQFGLKNYNQAAELYSQATEVQAELNGEMANENAEVLYQYGRCLYKVAVANSDVLGGKVAQEEKKKKNKKAAEVTESAKKEEGSETKEETKDADNKPYFLLEGDAGWTDSEDEGEDAEEAGEGEGEDPEDDFSTAFEILDLARVLFSRQLESLQSADTTSSSSNKGKEKSIDTPEIKHIKERLADTHDLIAEISLENERYEDAATDFKTSIELRSQLLPFEDTILTEAHFKLSLALEFASVTSLREAERQAEAGQKPDDEVKVDMNLREEAAKEMETAISSLKARIEKEQKAYEELNLETLEKEHGSQEKAKEVLAKKKLSLQDAKDMLEDMNLRLVDLRNDPSKQQSIDPNELVAGLLSEIVGANPEAQKKKLEEAKKTANDVTGLVRRGKKEKPTETTSSSSTVAEGTNGSSSKRKLEVEETGSGKRAKTEEI